MNDQEIEQERRRQQRLERLGIDNPVCTLCGMHDDQCLERHHIAGRAYDETTVIVCRNCNRKCSDAQRDHPGAVAELPDKLEQIGHLLLGLADFLRLLAEKLKEFGLILIDAARFKLIEDPARGDA